MTRKLKVLGLALVAVFAMTAISATVASASEFHSAESPARAHATNEGAHLFHAGVVGTISCTKATFEGTEYLESPQKTQTVLPTYENCTFLGVSTTVETNGCGYLFTQPTSVTTDTHTGSVDVECPEGSVITFEALGCLVEVGSQTGLNTVEYHNEANGTVRVVSKVGKIKYTAKGLCNTLPGTYENGQYTGTAIAHAEHDSGAIVGASVH